MSYRLACQLEDRITAIASVTGLLVFSPCEPSRPVPVLQMHGTADQVVPYAGVQFTIGHWTNHNNCPPDSVVVDLPDTDTTDQTTVTLTTYSPCDDSSEVLLYTINGGEHTWPGATLSIGVTNYDINGSVEIWDFFRKYSLDGFTGVKPSNPLQTGLVVRPMPVTGTSRIEVPGGHKYENILRLFDLSGKLLIERPHGHANEIVFTRGSLKSGLYILEITSGKRTFREKILIN
jgi:polyhydroxybutyrate depolymerase